MSGLQRTRTGAKGQTLGAMGRAELERRAITTALAMGGARTVDRARYGSYVVQSRTRARQAHTVSVVAGAYFCTCEAGRAGRPCWHAAAVYVAKVESRGVRVTGPGTQGAPGEAAPDNVIPLKRAG